MLNRHHFLIMSQDIFNQQAEENSIKNNQNQNPEDLSSNSNAKTPEEWAKTLIEKEKIEEKQQNLESADNDDNLFVDNSSNLDSSSDSAKLDNPSSISSSNLDGSNPIISTSLIDLIEPRILEEEMQSSYLKYAMSVIVSRALPDARDGLKPVHRRIIYTMHKMNLTPGSKFVKSARVVGEVLGKYHPHGDQSVYNAMARLAQDFSVRYQLVDGQGNFGSIDGDSPAAMRYTECRMHKPTMYMVKDIEKDTVNFVDNYDGSHQEPSVLPTMFPNLLVNGQTGIAVGMATEIPPHNLAEVMEGILHLIENPEATIEDLMKFIPGPDLATGGIIYGKNAILEAYKTGRGKARLRAKTELTENSIIVHEIPYQLNKSNLLIKIAELVKDKRIEGIRDIRDESSKTIRIVIETKRDASPEVVLNQLFKLSDLQTNVQFNLLALVDKGRQPKLLNLKEILQEFIAHRYEVVTRRTQFDLNKAQAELHILDGLKIALDFIDEVIKLIRGSNDKTEASEKLQSHFNLSQKQAEAILQMRLQTLTNMDKTKIEEQRNVLISLIAELQLILESDEKKRLVISEELRMVVEKVPSQRRTKIVEFDADDYNKEDLIEEEDVFVQLTVQQYLKVLPVNTFRQQGRGGRGVSSFNAKDDDFVQNSVLCSSHDVVYAFTNSGRVFKTRVFELPGGSRTGRGQNLVNYFELKNDEKITNILMITKKQEEEKIGSIVFATKQGIIKRTDLSDFGNVRKTGIIAISIREGDELIGTKLSSFDNDNIILSANNGRTVIFGIDKLRSMGRGATGVKGMKLKKGDILISLEISNKELAEGGEDDGALIEEVVLKEKTFPSLLVITKNGFGKQTDLAEYRKTNRATSGVKTLNMTKKTGKPVLVQVLYGTEENLLVTTKGGITICISPDAISQLGRATQGIKIIKLEKGDEVVSGSID